MAEIGNFFVTIGSKFDKKGFDKARQAIKGVAIAGAAMGAALVAAGLKAAAMAGIQERAELTLAQAMKQANTYTEAAYKHNLDYASSLQKVTAYGDEAIIGVQKMLTNFKIEGEMLDGLTKATLDLAAAKGMDLRAAADLVAKSVGSSTNALTRYGITVEGAVGSTERSQMAIENITKLFGGAAKANAETYLGKIEQLKNRWGDFVEKIGTNVIPVVLEIINAINVHLLPVMEEWIGKINESGEGVKWLANVLKFLMRVTVGVVSAFDLMGSAIAVVMAEVNAKVLKLVDTLARFIPGMKRVKNEMEIMQDAAKKGWDELSKKTSEYGATFEKISKFEISKTQEKETAKTGIFQTALLTRKDIQLTDDEEDLERQKEKDEAEQEIEQEDADVKAGIHEDLTDKLIAGVKMFGEAEKLTWKSSGILLKDMLKQELSNFVTVKIRELIAEKVKNLAIAIMNSTITFGAAAGQIGAVLGAAAAGIAGLRGIQSLDEGGFVKGPIGKPVMVQALGGEHFGGRESIGGGDINVYLQPIGTRQEAKRIGKIVGNEIFKKVKKSRRI